MGQGIGCKIYQNCGRDCTHCAAEEAKKKARKMEPRKTTIFEGEQAEKLAAKGLKNFETYNALYVTGLWQIGNLRALKYLISARTAGRHWKQRSQKNRAY